MPDIAASDTASKPLSEVERVVDTFIAPTQTFHDILRNSSWWLPWLLGIVVTLGYCAAIQQKIGWDKTYANILLQSSETQQARFAQLTPEQQARQKAIGAAFTKYIVWASPLIGLVFAAIATGVLLLTLNFGLGGQAKFGQMFAVWMYATLPLLLQGIIGIIVIYAGLDVDAFNLKNPLGTNIGYFLPSDAPPWLMALATSMDILTIWCLILLTIGCATVCRVKRGTAAVAIWGWWLLVMMVKVGVAAVL